MCFCVFVFFGSRELFWCLFGVFVGVCLMFCWCVLGALLVFAMCLFDVV